MVLDAARNNALAEHAQALAYMEGDMAEGVAELVFADMELFAGGYPEKTERIAEYLSHPENVNDLVQRLEGLADAYAEDASIMRFQYYNPDRMLAQFQKFAKEAVPFDAREGFAWNNHQIFITQDEIDAYLSRGGVYSDSRLATYAFYLAHEDNKERADFLKDRYGTGGQSHALSGADASHAEYDAKGLKLERGNYGNPDASILLKWPKVAQRVDYLIQNDRFLTAGDFARMPAYEREQMANRVIGFYSRLPQEIERPFTEDFFHEAARKELPVILEDPDKTAELLEKMDAVLAELPLDSEDYDKRLRNLTELHGYADGSFTIFPQPVKDDLIQVDAPTHQLSIFEFMQAAETALEGTEQTKEGETAPEELDEAVREIVNEEETEETVETDSQAAQAESILLQPMTADAANEYNALKAQYPDALVGFEQHGHYEFYGEDARMIS